VLPVRGGGSRGRGGSAASLAYCPFKCSDAATSAADSAAAAAAARWARLLAAPMQLEHSSQQISDFTASDSDSEPGQRGTSREPPPQGTGVVTTSCACSLESFGVPERGCGAPARTPTGTQIVPFQCGHCVGVGVGQGSGAHAALRRGFAHRLVARGPVRHLALPGAVAHGLAPGASPTLARVPPPAPVTHMGARGRGRGTRGCWMCGWRRCTRRT
jgi:hypothetical protein